MATHFDPYPDSYEAEQAPCGTWLGERSESSSNWAHVDCRLCLKRKTEIIAAHAVNEAAIIEQMGDMAAYFRRNEAACAAGGQDE
ncbi:hypothetical protein H3221_013605 [Pseudomonas sp. LMG 31766]|uniref:Uncharacterized protein n=1 Tax=Pseudomonas chaetocerotis TaxID=2758695 RepID=A0A931GBK2_9PSED|nr:hypothetical protein [Pseudomonas chaetocerotis]MBZ9665788.1 hypothetical protein [Pseudomonas chaetocerotis]